MVIGIDISIMKRGGGVTKYITRLLDILIQVRPEYSYKLYFNSFRSEQFPIVPHSFDKITTNIPDRLLQFLWLNFRFPSIESFVGPVDLFHSPAHSPIYAYTPPAKKWVVTVHDLFTFKLNYAKKIQNKEMKALRIIERYVDKVIAVSESTRNDLLEIIPSLNSRVVVIPEGVDESFFNPPFDIDILNKYAISTPYMLYVGAADHHKNLDRLLRVFKRLSEKIPHHLVLAGRMNDLYKAKIDFMRNLNLQNRTIFTGVIEERDLPTVYKGADLFILPSLYEGFGLVLLEAMAAGTPVVASNISSIPEVGGEAAQYFNPLDEDNIYNMIYNVLTDENILSTMKFKGIERAQSLSWEKMVLNTIQVYEEVAKS